MLLPSLRSLSPQQKPTLSLQYLAHFQSAVVPTDFPFQIKYANAQNVTFFAQGAGHGYSGTLKVVQNAIMIKLATNFDYANYNSADKTVAVGGGTVFSRLINSTYAGGREFSEYRTQLQNIILQHHADI